MGGWRCWMAAATATTSPRSPYAAASTQGSRGRYMTKTAKAKPATPASAATTDQWEVQAPRYLELSPNRDQGRSVTTATRANPTSATLPPRGLIGLGTGSAGGASWSTAGRHSRPTVTPRTGMAHTTQSGRPHTSHMPTDAAPG